MDGIGKKGMGKRYGDMHKEEDGNGWANRDREIGYRRIGNRANRDREGWVKKSCMEI